MELQYLQLRTPSHRQSPRTLACLPSQVTSQDQGIFGPYESTVLATTPEDKLLSGEGSTYPF